MLYFDIIHDWVQAITSALHLRRGRGRARKSLLHSQGSTRNRSACPGAAWGLYAMQEWNNWAAKMNQTPMISRFPFDPLSGNASVRRLQSTLHSVGRLGKSIRSVEAMECTEE